MQAVVKVLFLGLLPLASCIAENKETKQPNDSSSASAQKELNVANGTADFKPGIGVLAFESGSNKSFCTGTIISPRCILTAAHCGGSNIGFFQRADLNSTDTPHKYSAGLRYVKRTNEIQNFLDPGDLDNVNKDLQIIWMSPQLCVSPFPIQLQADGGDYCFGGTDASWPVFYAPIRSESPPAAPGEEPPTSDESVTYWGYGNNRFVPGVSIGFGIARRGTGIVHNYLNDRPLNSGEYFEFRPDSNALDPNIVCRGDSGGPVVRDRDPARIIGVAAKGMDICYGKATNAWSSATALDNGNSDWVRKRQKYFCRINASLVVAVAKEPNLELDDDYGRVTGILTDPVTSPANPFFDCGTDDTGNQVECAKYDFSGVLELTAVEHNSTFVRWVSGSALQGPVPFSEGCPCDNSTNRICKIETSKLNVKQEMRGMRCIAVFRRMPPTNSSSDSSSNTNGTSSTGIETSSAASTTEGTGTSTGDSGDIGDDTAEISTSDSSITGTDTGTGTSTNSTTGGSETSSTTSSDSTDTSTTTAGSNSGTTETSTGTSDVSNTGTSTTTTGGSSTTDASTGTADVSNTGTSTTTTGGSNSSTETSTSTADVSNTGTTTTTTGGSSSTTETSTSTSDVSNTGTTTTTTGGSSSTTETSTSTSDVSNTGTTTTTTGGSSSSTDSSTSTGGSATASSTTTTTTGGSSGGGGLANCEQLMPGCDANSGCHHCICPAGSAVPSYNQCDSNCNPLNYYVNPCNNL